MSEGCWGGPWLCGGTLLTWAACPDPAASSCMGALARTSCRGGGGGGAKGSSCAAAFFASASRAALSCVTGGGWYPILACVRGPTPASPPDAMAEQARQLAAVAADSTSGRPSSPSPRPTQSPRRPPPRGAPGCASRGTTAAAARRPHPHTPSQGSRPLAAQSGRGSRRPHTLQRRRRRRPRPPARPAARRAARARPAPRRCARTALCPCRPAAGAGFVWVEEEGGELQRSCSADLPWRLA